jgi:hypothetical protein
MPAPSLNSGNAADLPVKPELANFADGLFLPERQRPAAQAS